MSAQRQMLLDQDIDNVLVDRLLKKSKSRQMREIEDKNHCQSDLQNDLTVANNAVRLWLFSRNASRA